MSSLGFVYRRKILAWSSMMPRSDILDEPLDRLELTVRTYDALVSRFGKETIVREVVTMPTTDLRELLKPYHGYPTVLIKDIKQALQLVGYDLDTPSADLPRSKYAVVRSPSRMKAYKPE